MSEKRSLTAWLRMDKAFFTRPVHLPSIELVSVRYRQRAFPMHTHDCVVVGAVVSGAESLTVRGATHVVAQGEILHLHPHEAHANRSIGAEPLRYRVFYLPEASLSEYFDEHVTLSFSQPTTSDPKLCARLAALHGRLSEASSKRLEQESTFLSLALTLGRFSGSRELENLPHPKGVCLVREFIEAHYAEDFGLGNLAEIAGLSRYRIAHVFKTAFGLSPIAYRNQCRVNAARRLLLAGQPIADIAVELGFADQSHLNRHFQRIVGVSPHRYRQQ